MGKRQAVDSRGDIDNIFALANQLQLNTILPQIQSFLSPDKLQQLQEQFFATVVTALGDKWNLNTIAQALQQLVTQFVPQVSHMRIE